MVQESLTKQQFQALDKMCEDIGLSTLLLMENAGKSVADFIKQFINLHLADSLKSITVIVGPGNNGGDGLVAARHLVNYSFNLTVITTSEEEKYKTNNNAISTNYKIAVNLNIPILHWDSTSQSQLQNIFENSDIIVDAIFGIGLDRILSEKYRNIIKFINSYRTIASASKKSKAVFSIDIPSGLDADTGETYGEVVLADYTLSFTAFKKCFLMAKCRKFCGNIQIFDIGIPAKFKTQILKDKD